MKTIKLLKLKLRNFKGISNLSLELNGESVSVHGENGTGKTSIFDAWLWILFDKDSNHNKLGENVKTVGTSGLEHEVEAIISVNDKPMTLRKVYYEKYTKKRGQAVAEKTGNTTDYYINDVPVQLKEYNEHILSIIDPDTFKLLTSPLYFNEQLAWKQRRDVLINLAGDVTNEEVAAADPSLQKLLSVISDRSIDDHRKVIAAKKATINKEFEQIPHRIDEAVRALPNVDNLKSVNIEAFIQACTKDRETLQTKIIQMRNSDPVIELNNKLRQAENDLAICRKNDEQSKKEKLFALRVEVSGAQNERKGLLSDLQDVQDKKDTAQRRYDEYDKSRAKLRRDWTLVDERKFVDTVGDSCPTCKQSLPAHDVAEARNMALQNFNINQSQDFERIEKAGVAANGECERYSVTLERLALQEQDLSAKLHAVDKTYAEVTETFARANAETVNASAETMAAFALTETIHNEIEVVKTGDVNFEEIAAMENEITAIGKHSDDLYSKLSDLKAHASGSKRIDELKAKQKELAKEFAKLEEELFLAEQFVRVKVDMLESKINSKFKFAKFRLFEQQINGGLNDCCTLLIDGVPYSGGLNHAAQINAGLDVINVLSQYYGVCCPLFLDNRESVVKLIDTEAQIINLFVSAADKTLRIEI